MKLWSVIVLMVAALAALASPARAAPRPQHYESVTPACGSIREGLQKLGNLLKKISGVLDALNGGGDQANAMFVTDDLAAAHDFINDYEMKHATKQ